MFKLPLDSLNAALIRIKETKELFLPIKVGNECNLASWSEGQPADLVTLKTNNTAKDIMLPQSEDIYESHIKGGKISITASEHTFSSFVIFGAKACDVRAVAVLDNIYLQGDFVDEVYKARREAATIVSLACNKPATSCFCAVFDIDASYPTGDVVMWIADNYIYFEAQNEKGGEFVASIEDLLEKTDTAPVDELKQNIKEKINALPYKDLDLSLFDPKDVLKIFKMQNWENLHKACLGCGVCTYICPTCSCYDIRDHKAKCGKVTKFRCWDSCMYPDFTLMAHGNNRVSQKERFRQRFMHKLMYHNDKFGEMGCVGCGRCVNKCPANLNIIKVIKNLGGEGHV